MYMLKINISQFLTSNLFPKVFFLFSVYFIAKVFFIPSILKRERKKLELLNVVYKISCNDCETLY